MDNFAMEITVNRIGGKEMYPRDFGPRIEQVFPNGRQFYQLNAQVTAATWMRLELSPWKFVRVGLLSTELRLEHVNGQPVCFPRAVLLDVRPSDVPLYSNHIDYDSDIGVFSVGLRIPRSSWEPADLESEETTAETPSR